VGFISNLTLAPRPVDVAMTLSSSVGIGIAVNSCPFALLARLAVGAGPLALWWCVGVGVMIGVCSSYFAARLVPRLRRCSSKMRRCRCS